jgi:hypothetical protein
MLDNAIINMETINILLQGRPYNGLRYYGKLEWNERDIYLRHPSGGKDSRHPDGKTYLTSTGTMRGTELRVKTSEVSREIINYVKLSPASSEPREYKKTIKPNDLVLDTSEVGTKPRLAVEIVANSRLNGVLNAWKLHSTAPNVQVHRDKGLGQSLIIAVAGSLMVPPST